MPLGGAFRGIQPANGIIRPVTAQRLEQVAARGVDQLLFEIGGIDETVAREALRLAAGKLPLKTKIVKREDAPNPNDIEAGGESK